MTKRKSSDLCLLCQKNQAKQTNSHIIPAFLLDSNTGKRGKEFAFVFDTGKLETEIYYGRDRLDNPSTEVKKNPHTVDFYFCPACEKKLGALEGKNAAHITKNFRDAKFAGNYRIHSSEDLVWKDLLKVSPDDFNVFFLSIVWRKALQEQIESGTTIIPENDLDVIRGLIYSYVSGDFDTYKKLRGKYPMMILTADSFTDATANLVAVPNWFKRPVRFFMNEFLVLLYTEEDLIEGMNKPASFFQILPISKFLNTSDKPPSVIILPQDFWDDLTKRLLIDNADDFSQRLVRKIKKARKAIQRPPKSRKQKQKIKQAIRARRALKSKRRNKRKSIRK